MGFDAVKTWVVIPCYNEAGRLGLEEVRAVLGESEALGVCFVNDGSTDATGDVIREALDAGLARARLVDLPHNVGKAEAVRAGAMACLDADRIEYLAYWDADLSTPLSELWRFFRAMREHPDVEMLTGCRLKRLGARITRSPIRHVFGRMFATAASLAVGLPVYDSQCGAKLLRASLAREVFAEAFRSRWCFDLEILGRIRLARGPAETLRTVLELPLRQWTDRGDYHIRLRDCLLVPRDLWRIRRRYGGPRP